MRRSVHYLMWGEAEATGGISEDSQVVPQRPAWTAATSGCTFILPSIILLAQILELSLGTNLYQTGENIFFFERVPSFNADLQKQNSISDGESFAWSSVFHFSTACNCKIRHDGIEEKEKTDGDWDDWEGKQMEEEQRWRLSRSERTLDCSISHMAWMAFRLQRLAEFSDRNTNWAKCSPARRQTETDSTQGNEMTSGDSAPVGSWGLGWINSGKAGLTLELLRAVVKSK